MPLVVGTRLGPYEVLAAIGAGGMGEVYRAHDAKLNRDVALKVLPASLSDDPNRLARFRREAQVLASLNHPHIGHIFGFEDSGTTQALVLELIEGPTLADRIAQGPIPLAEALPIARQIAEALEAAHEQGIIHRDLKPANIKIRPDGTVKVLDFGLAKAIDPAPSSAAAIDAPTLSARATMPGVILGTASYMSPEQAAGKPVDRRTDLWSFGAVLMEMLTGRRVFEGESVSHVIANVLKSDPDWAALPAGTPAPVQRVLRRCLGKDPRRRLDSAKAAQMDLDEATTGDDVERRTGSPRSYRWLYYSVPVAAALLIATALWMPRAARESADPAPMFVSIDGPPGYVLGEDDRVVSRPLHSPMVFTPDGRSLIIQAARDRKPQLFIRSLKRRDALPIAGTEDARVPLVSPDGKWVGFFTRSELRKVPIEGGEPTTVCPWPSGLGPNGAVWSGNVILFADNSAGQIMRVSASGGVPSAVTVKPPAGRLHVAPSFLPDGKRFLFTDMSVVDLKDAHLMVQSTEGGAPHEVAANAIDGRILASGQLAFMRLGSLLTVDFDMTRGQTVGTPVVTMRDVMQDGLLNRSGAQVTGAGMFAVSSLGALATIRGTVVGGKDAQLVWIAPDGRSASAEPTSGAPEGPRTFARISPDGSRFVTHVASALRREVWFGDWTRNTWSNCVECATSSTVRGESVWSPDGKRLLSEGHGDSLVEHVIDAFGPDRTVVRETARHLTPAQWLRDGRIVYLSQTLTSLAIPEIKLLEPGTTAGRVLATGFSPAVSPDGKWLAYQSVDTGVGAVILQSFPVPTTSRPVSAGGGANPAWSPDGKSLYYLDGSNQDLSQVFAVSVRTTPELAVGAPRQLFTHSNFGCTPLRCFEVAADGRFLLFEHKEGHFDPVTRVDLLLNWTPTLYAR